MSKVSCFIVPFEGSGGSTSEREHYRGWWHLASQFPRGSGVFFSVALSSRAVTLFILFDVGIYDVLARSILESSDTIEDSGT